jgi:hypothetical protein
MKNAFIILLAASAGPIACQSPPADPRSAAVQASAVSSGESALAIPKPIAGGDFFPDSPHHRAGIIHQFFPGPLGTSFGFDGVWAEPNEITDFNGTVAQVFMGGMAVDQNGNQYVVDVDNRVYQGEFIGRNGEHARGTFCEI